MLIACNTVKQDNHAVIEYRGQIAPEKGTHERVAALATMEAALQASMTAHAQTEAALRHMTQFHNQVLECTSNAVMALDTEGRFTFTNRRTFDMTGYSAEVLLGQPLEILFPDNYRSTIRHHLQTALLHDVEITHCELPIQRSDGTVRIVRMALVPLVRDDDSTGVVVTADDITEQVQAEEYIRDLNTQLEQRVAERTAQLEAINQELEAFSYSVSHDLRAPLRSVDGFSQALLEDYADVLDADGQDYLRRIHAATKRMSQLIDGLLDLSHVTQSALQCASVNLSVIASEIARELQQAEPARQVTFTIEDNIVAQADASLLSVVLDNLLSNAWKFTSKQSHAEICFDMAYYDGLLVYRVRDNGVGFNMAYAHRLFGAFQRLHSADEFAGTGIGLATVQRIIHRHGGRIWAESAVGGGATFCFTLSGE